jgi:hypothetical protein
MATSYSENCVESSDSDSSPEDTINDVGGDGIGEVEVCGRAQEEEEDTCVSISTRKRRYMSYLHDISSMPQRLKVQALTRGSARRAPDLPAEPQTDVDDVDDQNACVSANSSPKSLKSVSSNADVASPTVLSEVESPESASSSSDAETDDTELIGDISSNLSETEEILDSDGDANESFSREGQPDNNADTYLFPGCSLTRCFSAFLLMQFILQHKLTKRASEDLVKLLCAHLPGNHAGFQSLYTLKNYFTQSFGATEIELVRLCSVCRSKLDNDMQQCPNPMCWDVGASTYQFHQMDIASRITTLFKG